MKKKILIAAVALATMAAPAFANAPTRTDVGTLQDNQIARPTDSGVNGDVFTSPFDRARQDRTDMRPMLDRNRNNLVPPRMDASGVPDPRI